MTSVATRWETLEAWIEENSIEFFTVHELAAALGSTAREASRMIQAYLAAQRGRRSKTAYVLKRTGRTKRAVWSVGETNADVRTMGRVIFDDFGTTLKRAYKPDVERIRAVNPRAARYVTARMETLDAAVQLLGAALDAEVEFQLAEVEAA